MKKRVFSWALALVMLMALAVPALAAAEPEPEYRLASVKRAYSNGMGDIIEATAGFTYDQGGYLPTEVLEEIASSGSQIKTTAVYDEAGRLTSLEDGDVTSPDVYTETYVYDERGDLVEQNAGENHYAYKYTYDEDDHCIREEYTGSDNFSGEFTYVTDYTYDEAGNRIRGEETSDYFGSPSSNVTEYTYDETGNCVKEEYTSDSGYTSVTDYTYDEAGNCIREEFTSTSSDGSVSNKVTERTYDEDGRSITKIESNDGTSIIYGTPLLHLYWESATYDLGGGVTHSTNSFSVSLRDSEEESIVSFSCSCDGEPTLTYDDNGYLVRVDGAAGNYIELTYEPVA